MSDTFLESDEQEVQEVQEESIPMEYVQRSVFLSMVENCIPLCEMHSILKKIYEDKAPCLKTVSNWRVKYLNGEFSVCSGRKSGARKQASKSKETGEERVKRGRKSAVKSAMKSVKAKKTIEEAQESEFVEYHFGARTRARLEKVQGM